MALSARKKKLYEFCSKTNLKQNQYNNFFSGQIITNKYWLMLFGAHIPVNDLINPWKLSLYACHRLFFFLFSY